MSQKQPFNARAMAVGIVYGEMAQLAQQARERAAVVRCCFPVSGTTQAAADVLSAKADILEEIVGRLIAEAGA